MEVVWAGPPVTAHEVTRALEETVGWKAQTVKTLLARLVKKGALRFEEKGHRYLYHPEVTREAAVAAETESFLDRISRVSLAPILAHLVESNRSLDVAELEALRKLLPPHPEEPGENA